MLTPAHFSVDPRHATIRRNHMAEREIDQQVYALYGLTPEEIAIVEGTAP